MEKFYYSSSVKGFFSSVVHSLEQMPGDCVEISREKYDEIFSGQSEGKLIVSNEEGYPSLTENAVDHNQLERDWRNIELKRADEELNKVQDSDPKATGTVAEWRQYRKDLRGWPENLNFPNSLFRPKSPDIKESL